MRPRTTTCKPSAGRKRSSRAEERNITTRICAFPSLRVKYRWPESGARKFEISPSTHASEYSRSMCERTAATRSRTFHTRRSGGRKLKPIWSAREDIEGSVPQGTVFVGNQQEKSEGNEGPGGDAPPRARSGKATL